MRIHSVGIDLGKTTFHLVALGAAGKMLVRKKFTQRQLLTYTANMQTSRIGLEACSGAHFLGGVLRKQGRDVRLIAAQFVKPFVKSNKNDFVDAEAIAEAVERKNVRFVPIKTDDQLDLQAIHRVRDRLDSIPSAHLSITAPPATSSTTPVIQPASPDARKTAAHATSSGVPRRLSG
jgi:transposase